jgi:3-methyladenine DNA glycosylase/8-oxoguanine DNA glycosylase
VSTRVTPARLSLGTGIREVSSRDATLGAFIERAGPIKHEPRDPDGPFGALVRAIAFQQLAGAAARAIHGRVLATVDGALTPAALAAVPDDVLRAAGLSASKLASLRDLTAKVSSGLVVLDRTSRLSDDELVARLSQVRGIGRWTAEMFLMFELRRLDVWPVDDLGVRRGYASIWQLEERPTPKLLDPLGERFRPYRSVVARYCWVAARTITPTA